MKNVSESLQFFVGSKRIKAMPMNRKEYSDYRGWTMPEYENPKNDGYLVEYLDSPNSNHENHNGYISWSPKDVFERAYQKNGNLSFGHALEALEQGELVTRQGWNGKGMFLFMRPGDSLSVDMIINRVKSLPQSLKDYFASYHWLDADTDKPLSDEEAMVDFKPYICMKAADNSIVNGWLASQTDMLSKDWLILSDIE